MSTGPSKLWMNEVGAVLPTAAEELDITLDSCQIARLARLGEFLAERNRDVNLTAIADPAEITRRHFVDSLTLALAFPALDSHEIRNVVDVGSGAGFPGLVLAIAFPWLSVTMIDSVAKKTAFTTQAIEKLALTNAQVITGRSELLARSDSRESFDLATARAVAELRVLAEYCAPLTRIGGYIAFYKSGDMRNELHAAESSMRRLNLEMPSVIHVPPSVGLSGLRVIVLTRKTAALGETFPRREGVAKRRPL